MARRKKTNFPRGQRGPDAAAAIYSLEFRRRVVRAMVIDGVSKFKIARDFGISPTCAGVWKRHHLSGYYSLGEL